MNVAACHPPSPQGLSEWPGSPVNAWGAAQAPRALGLDGVVLHVDLEFCLVKSDVSGGWAWGWMLARRPQEAVLGGGACLPLLDQSRMRASPWGLAQGRGPPPTPQGLAPSWLQLICPPPS